MRMSRVVFWMSLAFSGYSRRALKKAEPFQDSLYKASSLAQLKQSSPLKAKFLMLLVSFNPAAAGSIGRRPVKNSKRNCGVEKLKRFTGGARMEEGTEEGKAFKALGYNVGRQIGQQIACESPEEVDAVISGIRTALLKEAPMPDQSLYEAKATNILQEREKAKAAAIVAESENALAEAAKEEGATKTDTGLVFLSLTEGEGASPSATDTVEVHYEGKLTDGSIFDSSYQRGETISFPLSGVIAGWTEGLQLMKVGGKAKLTIPYNLGYGERGNPPVIPGKATLVFTVELIAIKS
mmetsp:Transcript_160255/g.282706  ORF Transcript_160255/g.282706 Transcript_160255/m.282706 type:complete len:295 (-) Transcript_160255:34-918(-)